MPKRMALPFNLAARRVHVEVTLDEEHPAQFVDAFVDSLDLDALGFVRKRHFNGTKPYAPEPLLKVTLFGWMERTRSTRALAKACRYDARYLFLTRGEPPSRSTIVRFWLDHYARFEDLFTHLVRLAQQAGLIGSQLHALDGTKLLAASSMHTALHEKGLKKSTRHSPVNSKSSLRVLPSSARRSAPSRSPAPSRP